MANTEMLKLISTTGSLSGFSNLFRRDLRLWWGTRFGLIHLVIWPVILNGIIAIIIVNEGEVPNIALSAIEPFMGISYWFPIIGILIIAQNAIIGERLSGTAAWILSGPVSRRAFLLSKLIPIAIGGLTTMVALPGLIAFFEFSLIPADGSSLAFGSLLAGQSVMALQFIFFLTLTFLAGTLVNSRGLVITIPIVVWLGALLPLQILPSWFVNLTPWPITSMAWTLARGDTPESLMSLLSTVVWIIAFVIIALWRFEREEF